VTDVEAEALRQPGGPACLTEIQDIVSGYDDAPALLEREGIDDRAVDLWSPLVAVTRTADRADAGARTRELLDMAREVSAVREADAGAGMTARLVEALQAIRTGH